MANALNLTIPLKQDSETLEALQQLKATFAQKIQPTIDAVLESSKIVHFARIVVIDDKYLQVLTEFDESPELYTEFFRTRLGPVFEKIFSLAEGAKPWEELNNRAAFFAFTHKFNIHSLGTSTGDGEDRGYLYSAMGDLEVKNIRKALVENGLAAALAG